MCVCVCFEWLIKCFLCFGCSTNGTYLNWEKLRKNSAEAKVGHGDIISFAAPPQHGNILICD